MAVEVIMPKAGMAMEEGTVVKWLKNEGERIEAGEPLLEILTDKVNMEIEALASGVLLKILKSEGEVVPVTHTIALIGEPGEKIEVEAPLSKTETAGKDKDAGREDGDIQEKDARDEAREAATVTGALSGKVAATPQAKTLAQRKGIDLALITGTGQYGEIKARDVEAVRSVTATPLARRIAEDNNVELSKIRGSGFGGKVRKEDVLADMEKTAGDIRVPLKGMRKLIAERMTKSHLEAPPVTMNIKADVTELSTFRKKLSDALDVKISFNDFILKASAMALREYPYMNACIEGNEILRKNEINVGMAVALEDGLIVPVIKNAVNLSLKEMSLKAKELVSKAREGKLPIDEFTGGTFTVSNLGMYDIVAFTPIINPPESAILGVCAIENELKIVGDKVVRRDIMGLSLTFDHRVVDGAQAAMFLRRIKALLENSLEIIA